MLNNKNKTQSSHTFIQEPANLPFVIPRPLREESLCKAFVRSTKKKEVILEFEGMLLSKTEIYLNLLKRLEWRLGVYSNFSDLYELENQSYLFRYKRKLPFSNDLVFADKSKYKKQVDPMISFYNARKFLLNFKNKKMIVKSRTLTLCVRKHLRKRRVSPKKEISFLSCSFFGKRAHLNCKKRESSSYRFWFIRNLKLIGILKALYLKSWGLKYTKPSKAQENCKEDSSIVQLADYYKQGKSIKSKIRLTKK